MEKVRNIALEQILQQAENLHWSYTIYREPEGTYNGWRCDERNYAELGKYSPAGEDFHMIIDFDADNPVESFLEDLKMYVDDFDIDEHVEGWIPERGKGGCPSSIRELSADAEVIKDMILELFEICNRKGVNHS
jgi:hypothetical protein